MMPSVFQPLSLLLVLSLPKTHAFISTSNGKRVRPTTGSFFGSVLDLTDENFANVLYGPSSFSTPLRLVDCYAPFCGPCRLMEPILESIADNYDSETQLLVCRYNVEGDNSTADRRRSTSFKVELALQGCVVQALPSLILLNTDGKILKHWEGLVTKETMDEHLKNHLAESVAQSKGPPVPDITSIDSQAQTTSKGLIGMSSWEQQKDDAYMLANPFVI